MKRLAIVISCAALVASAASAAPVHSSAKSRPRAGAPSASQARTRVPTSADAALKACGAAPAAQKEAPGSPDSAYTLKGGSEGTVFKSLTVEGEDRIRFDIERPELQIDLDPSKAPGLDWGSARDVL